MPDGGGWFQAFVALEAKKKADSSQLLAVPEMWAALPDDILMSWWRGLGMCGFILVQNNVTWK
jgi:hypothetical protein